MTIKPLNGEDWEVFVAWAEAENWRISFQEQRLFQSQWRPYFYVLWHNGERCAFVSAVIYKTSAWIGNLIVKPQLRKRGYGSELFSDALERLSNHSRVNRVWLTASEQGAPLYRQHGFVDIDCVERWQSVGRGTHAIEHRVDLELLTECDQRCWGESRGTLLRMLADDGHLLIEAEALMLLQPGLDFWFAGPWLNHQHSSISCKRLIERVLTQVPLGKEIMIDVLISSGVMLALQQAGFERLGSNQLMCRSDEPVSLNGVVSLASLGSLG